MSEICHGWTCCKCDNETYHMSYGVNVYDHVRKIGH